MVKEYKVPIKSGSFIVCRDMEMINPGWVTMPVIAMPSLFFFLFFFYCRVNNKAFSYEFEINASVGINLICSAHNC